MDTTKAPELCAVCGQSDCTIPGLHGMIRDRARLARTQTQARRPVRRFPPKDLTAY